MNPLNSIDALRREIGLGRYMKKTMASIERSLRPKTIKHPITFRRAVDSEVMPEGYNLD